MIPGSPAVTGAGVLCPVATGSLGERLGLNQVRRLDRLSQLVLVAAAHAASEARLEEVDGDRIGVVVGTGLGCLEKTEAYLKGIARAGLDHADPLGFPDSVANAPAAHCTIALRARGPSLTVSQREISGESAVILGALLLRRGDVDAVLVAAGDATSRHARRILSPLLPGSRPGEGAGALVLEAAESAARRGARILGRLLGYAQASRPVDRRSARLAPPDAVVEAIRGAGSMAGFSPGAMAGIPIPCAEDSSALGGWCMADGVLRAVLALESLEEGRHAAALVARAARGGTAAALLFGPPNHGS